MPDDILQVGPPGRNTEGERLAAQLTVCDGLLDRDAALLMLQMFAAIEPLDALRGDPMKSGWCMSRGAAQHARCRLPDECKCACHAPEAPSDSTKASE
jgi:hypothetical protein